MDKKPNPKKEQALRKYWLEFVASGPTRGQILEVVRMVEGLREVAWAEFLTLKPTDEELMSLLTIEVVSWWHIEYLPLTQLANHSQNEVLLRLVIQRCTKRRNDDYLAIASQAAEQLLAIQSSKESLLHIIEQIPKEFSVREKAAWKLLENGASNSDLAAIISWIKNQAIQEAAGRKLLAQEPDERELFTVMRNVPALSSEAWAVLKPIASAFLLSQIVEMNPPAFRLEAGKLLLEKPPVFSHLFEIMEHEPALHEEAWAKLKTLDLSNTWLGAIARVAPKFTGRTLELMKVPPRDADTIYHDMLDTQTWGPIQ